MNSISHNSFLKKTLCALVIVAGFFWSAHAYAATLGLSPSTATHENGEAFSVSVVVDSSGTAINAVSGTVLYPADTLQVLSLSKASSVVNFWVTEPSFSTASGKIHFEGIVLNPGYNGSNGKIMTITFKGKKNALAQLSFQSSSVLANDGAGTNVLTSSGKGSYTITPAQDKPQTAEPVPVAEPQPLPETPAPQDITLVPKEELESPILTDYPSYLRPGEFLVVHGVTYPNMRVIISLQNRGDDKSFSFGHIMYTSDNYSHNSEKTIIKSDEHGEFTYVSSKNLDPGSYDLWAEAFSDTGDKSKPTEKIFVTVYKGLFLRFGSSLLDVLVVVVPLIALLIIVALLVRYSWKKYRRLKQVLDTEVESANTLANRAFDVLKEDGNMITTAAQSGKERLLAEQQSKDISEAQRLIDEKIRGIKDHFKI